MTGNSTATANCNVKSRDAGVTEGQFAREWMAESAAAVHVASDRRRVKNEVAMRAEWRDLAA